MPVSRIATISSEVATGRRMKGREGFTRLSRVQGGHGVPVPLPLAPVPPCPLAPPWPLAPLVAAWPLARFRRFLPPLLVPSAPGAPPLAAPAAAPLWVDPSWADPIVTWVPSFNLS